MSLIFTKNTRKSAAGETEFEVRTLGAEFFISKEEFTKAVLDGNVSFKVNKPVYEKDLEQYK